MSISEKIKGMKNKIQQAIKLRQTTKISALSSGNVSKYEFFTGKYVLLEKNLPDKAAALKRFEYFLLSKELKKQTSVP